MDEVQHLSIRGAKSLHKKLGEHREAAELARRLTVIETRVPSALENPDLTRSQLDEARLNRLFDDLEFGGMLRRRCLMTGQ
jgi:DNA polymerase-1